MGPARQIHIAPALSSSGPGANLILALAPMDLFRDKVPPGTIPPIHDKMMFVGCGYGVRQLLRHHFVFAPVRYSTSAARCFWLLHK